MAAAKLKKVLCHGLIATLEILFLRLVRSWFGSPVNDVYCGMRAFKKSFYESMKMKCTGMEFATEMIIKGTIAGAKIQEVPITLHRDGRIQHPPHLRTIRDGWKTLAFLFYLLHQSYSSSLVL